MACRDRKNGFSTRKTEEPGHHFSDSSPVSGTRNRKSRSKEQKSATIQQMQEHFDKREKILLDKIEKMEQKQNYHMLISAITPFVAEPIRKKLTSLFNGTQQPANTDQLVQQIKPLLKNLPDELQGQLMDVVKGYLRGRRDVDLGVI